MGTAGFCCISSESALLRVWCLFKHFVCFLGRLASLNLQTHTSEPLRFAVLNLTQPSARCCKHDHAYFSFAQRAGLLYHTPSDSCVRVSNAYAYYRYRRPPADKFFPHTRFDNNTWQRSHPDPTLFPCAPSVCLHLIIIMCSGSITSESCMAGHKRNFDDIESQQDWV